jgi:predicted AlkP superfamily phosphohydrolase/phosphomutase
MSQPHKPKFVVFSIDGVPFGLMQRMFDEGIMPNLAKLAQQHTFQQMRSIQPCVSSVAWTCFSTGKNPGKHGIYGFIDRAEDSYGLAFPNTRTMTSKTIWEILSDSGKRVFGMNIPVSYPPRKVNGIIIGGFLAPNLDKIVYPASESDYLKSINYVIDNDAAGARKDKHAFVDDLYNTHERRMEAMFHYLDQEDWDFFHTHVMGSDRANHFLFTKMQENHPKFAPAFFEYYRRVDASLGQLLQRIGDDTPIMIFSDHGFCSIKNEVNLSKVLIDKGWTVVADEPQHPLSINPEKSKAYCLIPGRIFINLQAREPAGIVPLDQYHATRQAIAKDLLELTAPNGDPVIDKVIMREDVYWSGDGSTRGNLTPELSAQQTDTYGKAADLLAIPHDGYDLKLGLVAPEVFTKTEMEGMHTYHDAFLVARNVDIPTDNLEILMLTRPIIEKLGVTVPDDLDGQDKAITPNFELKTI